MEVTFEGGRFTAHSAPVAALAELGALQTVLLLVARQKFKDAHPGRQRVPGGFPDAAQLHLVAIRKNCLTVSLDRPDAAAWRPTLFDRNVFEEARDITLEALKSADVAGSLPAGFPAAALGPLGVVGRQLAEDESLLLRGMNGTARVSQRSREWIAKMVHKPVERDVVLEGEVEEIDDAKDTFVLRTSRGKVVVPFRAHQRTTVVEAVRDRPIARVRVRGRLILQTMLPVEELELVDHERAADVLKLWARIDHLAQAPSGWLDGDGEPPSEQARACAREVLARLIVDYSEIERPRLYPRPDGGLQAEWIIGEWAAEAVFSATAESVTLEATNGTNGEDRALELQGTQISADNVTAMADWLSSLAAEGSRNV